MCVISPRRLLGFASQHLGYITRTPWKLQCMLYPLWIYWSLSHNTSGISQGPLGSCSVCNIPRGLLGSVSQLLGFISKDPWVAVVVYCMFLDCYYNSKKSCIIQMFFSSNRKPLQELLKQLTKIQKYT